MTEQGVLTFTNLSHSLTRKDYLNLFSEFGKTTKLYIDPSREYGHVTYENINDALKARKTLNDRSPYNLDFTESVTVTSPSESNNKYLSETNMASKYQDVYGNVVFEYVDVNGRLLKTIVSVDGEVYVPVTELKKSGFEIFTKGSLPRRGQCQYFDELVYKQFENYLKIKVVKYIRLHNLKISEDRISRARAKAKQDYASYHQPNSSFREYDNNRDMPTNSGRIRSRSTPRTNNLNVDMQPSYNESRGRVRNNNDVSNLQSKDYKGHGCYGRDSSGSSFDNNTNKGGNSMRNDGSYFQRNRRSDGYSHNNRYDDKSCGRLRQPRNQNNKTESSGNSKFVIFSNASQDNEYNSKRSPLNITQNITRSEPSEQQESPESPLSSIAGSSKSFLDHPLNINTKTEPKQKQLRAPQNTYDVPAEQSLLKTGALVMLITQENGSLFVRTKDDIIRLKEIVQEITCLQDESLEKEPNVNQMVLSRYNDSYYRAKVISIENSNAVVHYIDYGNTETVSLKEFKNVNEKLANINRTLSRIKLQGFVDQQFSDKALQFLEDCFDKREKLTAVAKSNGTFDLLFKDDSSLCEKLMALDKPEVKESPKKIEVKPVLPKEEFIRLSDIPKCKLASGKSQGICLFTGELEQSGIITFCLNDLKSVESMTDLTIKITNHVEQDSKPYKPQEGEVCLAKYEGEWYRAVCKKQGENNKFEVFYFDFGNFENVSTNNIRKMPNLLKNIECCAAVCTLEGLSQLKEMEKPLLDEIKHLLTENEIYEIEVVGENEEGYSIRVPSIYSQLKEKGLL